MPDRTAPIEDGDVPVRGRPRHRWGRPRWTRGPWRQVWRRQRLNFTGLLLAVAFVCASLTPSLLPRGWALQGLVSGVVAAVAYAAGTLASHLIRAVLPAEPAPAVKRVAWWVLLVGGLLAIGVFLNLGARWQQDLHAVMELEEPVPVSYTGTAAITLVVLLLLVVVGRSLHRLTRWTARRLRHWIPPPLASVVAGLLVAVLVVGVLDGVVLRAFFTAADNVAATVDQAMSEEISRPAGGRRSGGPGSLVAWEELGSKGRAFVAGGPDAAELEEFSGRPAREPVRVYVGLQAAETDRERAALTVREAERGGAFDRSVLAVVVPTGTGWVNPAVADTLEYLHNGDTALVSMQYSYLPSWLSFLVDPGRAREAGRELFNRVYDRWEELPEETRPLLLAVGKSLGSHGSEAAFSGLADVRNRTDGALWVGPPNFNHLWRELTARRDPGSLQRRPVVEGGRTVRFADDPADLERPPGRWPRPRVIYLQNASDPVVWWSPNLILRRPDWLTEPRGRDVLRAVRWFPLVTFLQLSVDMLQAGNVPDGHGHRYGPDLADAWVAVARPAGWTAADTARLRAVITDRLTAARK